MTYSVAAALALICAAIPLLFQNGWLPTPNAQLLMAPYYLAFAVALAIVYHLWFDRNKQVHWLLLASQRIVWWLALIAYLVVLTLSVRFFLR